MDCERSNQLAEGDLEFYLKNLLTALAIIILVIFAVYLTVQSLNALERHLNEGLKRSDRPEQKTESAGLDTPPTAGLGTEGKPSAGGKPHIGQSGPDEACSVLSPSHFLIAGNFSPDERVRDSVYVVLSRTGGCDSNQDYFWSSGVESCGEGQATGDTREVREQAHMEVPSMVTIWGCVPRAVSTEKRNHSDRWGSVQPAPIFHLKSDGKLKTMCALDGDRTCVPNAHREAHITLCGREADGLPAGFHTPSYEGSIPSPAPRLPAQIIDGCRIGEDAAKQSETGVIALRGRARYPGRPLPAKDCISDALEPGLFLTLTVQALRWGEAPSGHHSRLAGNRIKASPLTP